MTLLEKEAADKREQVFRYALVFIFVLGALLRFYKLGTKSLWFDEVSTYDDAFLEYGFWRRTHMLYFIMVRFFLNFGHNEFCLRFTSALFGILGLGAIYFAGKEIFNDKRVGLLSALFIALSRVHIHFSQEARYYSVMFFLSALSLYLFANFLRRRRLISLLLLPLVCFANFLNHMTSLVFSGVLLAWLPFSMVTTKNGREILSGWWVFVRDKFKKREESRRKGRNKKRKRKRPPKTKPAWSSVFVKLVVIILVVSLLLVSAWAVWKIGEIGYRRSKSIRLFAAPAEGVRADFRFFFNDHFLYYGPVVIPSTPMRAYLVYLFIFFSVVGYGRALIKHFAFGGFFLVCLVVTFTLLFSVPIKQYYSSKYILFIYPANAVCIMYGFLSFADFLRKMLVGKFKLRSSYAGWILYSVFLIPLIREDIGRINQYYRGESINVKGAVRDAAQDFGENDFIAAYGLTGGPTRYYANYFGIPKQQFKFLMFEKGDGTRSIHILLKCAKHGGNVWFIFGWQYDIRPYLRSWVEKNFEHVKTYPSMIGRENDVTLWKWKYKGRLLSEESPVLLNLDFSPLEQVDYELGGGNLVSAEADVFAHHDIDALIEYAGNAEELPSSLTLQIITDGKKAAVIQKPADATRADIVAPLPFSFGAHNIKFLLKSSSELKGESRRLKFMLKRWYPNRKYVYAVDYDSGSKTYDMECRTEENIPYLFMQFNGFASYKVDVEASGIYLFGLIAKNDPPGPIIYQVEAGGKPMGILSFHGADDSWQQKRFPIFLEKGSHTFSIYFISDRYLAEADPSSDNDSYLGLFYLEKVEGRTHLMDERAVISADTLVPISKYLPENKVNLSEKGIAWTTNGLINPRNEKITIGGETFEALSGEVAYDLSTAGFILPPIDVEPGKILYFSVRAKVRDLCNHSANVVLFFLDQSGKLLGQRWVNAQGISDTAGDTKFIYLERVAKDVATVIIHFAVYEKSTKQFLKTATVWFYDFRSDVELLPRDRPPPLEGGSP